MINSQRDNTLIISLFTAFSISIAMTPWINSDSLIIPKLIILFAGASYLFPRIFLIYHISQKNLFSKVLISTLILYIIQLLIVIIRSDAPFEQQIFGRTGRGLGLITELSLIILLLLFMVYVKFEDIRVIFKFLLAACLISSFYSLAQRFNLDIFNWNTRTNGIIGTLGNPNFQSSFASIALIPALVFFNLNRRGLIKTLFLLTPIISVIFVAQSTQGYVASFISIGLFITLYFWYKNKKLFYVAILAALASLILIVQGMLNKGPLSYFLYKVSVQSRGEMLRNSFSVAKDHPLTGVGIDSLGDYYLMYKDQRTVDGINEFTDHAHNSIVNYAATGGFPLAILYLFLILLTILSAIFLIARTKEFDKNLIALVCTWVCFLSQSMISPATITLVTWNSIFMGAIIGLRVNKELNIASIAILSQKSNLLSRPVGIFLLFISLLITYPYFNVDKMQQDSARLGDANLAIKSARSFPESTVRYSRIGQALISANLAPQALQIGRAAAQFNPNAASAWGLILVNNLGTKEERNNALAQLQRLDPTNTEIRKFVIP